MSFTPFQSLSAKAVPILQDNIDTDQIIPSREMKTVSKTGLGAGLFANWRYKTAGGREQNPDFVLNRPVYQGAKILLSGQNFGCGSSREHAVWALKDFGFQVVIAESFGEIFYNNCLRNGILPITLPKAYIQTLAETSKQVEVDLENGVLTAGNHEFAFTIPAHEREVLLKGLDPISQTLQYQDEISRYLIADQKKRPWVYA